MVSRRLRLAWLCVMVPACTARAATFTPTNTAELVTFLSAANVNGQDDAFDLGGRTFTLTNIPGDSHFS